MAKKNNKTEDQFAQVEGALTKTEQFIEDNQDKLVKIVGAFVAVACLFLGYQNFYLELQILVSIHNCNNHHKIFLKLSFVSLTNSN